MMPTSRANDVSLPAVLSGQPAVTIDQTAANRWPLITAEDEAAVLAVLRDGDLSTHPVIRELERDYRLLTGRQFALAHSNGTAALLAAFFALDLQPGDEVLVPTATWWASVLPMLWLGLVPVFCESEEERLGIDPEDAERRITERTRAIVVVHLWGLPSKMSELFALADRHRLKIVEDASHAHGATWRSRPCGSLGDISVFSLQGDKLAPAGEGGVLLTDDQEYYERAVCLGDVMRIWELDSENRRFFATSFGIKTRIAPLSAAVARTQLAHLEERNERRARNLVYLSEALEQLGCFHTFLPPRHIRRTYFEFLVRYEEELCGLSIERLSQCLALEGCLVSAPRYPLIHQQPFFTEGHWKQIARLPVDHPALKMEMPELPKTASQTHRMLRLPCFPNADSALLDQYIEAFTKVTVHARSIRDSTKSPAS
jgi:dTDP-4-amino-4,6-dideoxygalactose transaminase